MRATIALLLFSIAAAQAGEKLPSIAKGSDYGKARNALIAMGWAPATMPDAQSCDGDPRCKDRPEMEACAGTGLANCLFTWRKGAILIEVSTIGEEPQIDAITCRSGCGK